MTIQNQMLSFPSGDERLYAFYARPTGDGPFPAIVLIHEAFGLNEDIKGIAQRFATAGYATLAVDLFSGRNRAVCMARFMHGIFTDSFEHQGIHDLKEALSFLSERPEVDAARVGAVGYCMGGSFAVAWACADNRLKAVAPHYGFNPRPIEAVRRACPIVGAYPDRDFTTAQGRALNTFLDTTDIPHDITIYDNTLHSFANKGGAYAPEAAEEAFRRIVEFFEVHVAGKPQTA